MTGSCRVEAHLKGPSETIDLVLERLGFYHGSPSPINDDAMKPSPQEAELQTIVHDLPADCSQSVVLNLRRVDTLSKKPMSGWYLLTVSCLVFNFMRCAFISPMDAPWLVPATYSVMAWMDHRIPQEQQLFRCLDHLIKGLSKFGIVFNLNL